MTQSIPDRVELNVFDALRLGGEAIKAWQFGDAENIFRAVLAAEPNNLHAASALAVCLIEQKKCDEALPVLDHAGGLVRDELVALSCNRGRALCDLGRTQEALDAFNYVLRSFPQHMISLYNRGLAHLQMGHHDSAIADFNAVLLKEPWNDKARFGRGFANLVLGNYAEGFHDYESRLKDKIDEPDVPLWTGLEPLAGKTILVHGEQGLGDNIMFARYLPMLVERGATVKVWTPDSVKPLLEHLEGVELVGEYGAWGHFDTWVRFMSLAHCFGTTADRVPPPLRLPPEMTWRKRKGGKLRVGLVWTGSRSSRYDEYRSIPLRALEPLFGVPNVEFRSLQLEVRESDAEAYMLAVRSGLRFCPLFEDFAETARAMTELDLVLTVDTSVAHLAGTVGVPTWIMLTKFRTYWLWIEKRTTSPWYPSARLFRQQYDGEWGDVVFHVQNELTALAARAA